MAAMEGSTAAAADGQAVEYADQRRDVPWMIIGIALLIVVLVILKGPHEVAQKALNGLSGGSVYALGAVGLTLVYGILKLTNFAHGDFLTFGGYMAYVVNVSLGGPLILGVLFAVVATAAMAIAFEKILWGPLRKRRAGSLQLLLSSIGLAFIIRAGIQFFFSTEVKQLDVNTTTTVDFLGLSIGRTQFIVVVVGIATLLAVAALLRYSLLGKQMRALSDDLDLAETSGINTSRVILYTWLFAGGLAGLAGVLDASITNLKPEFGFELLLPIFAAVVLGGIGDAFGALIGGLALGIFIEWSTLFVPPEWKITFGFLALIIVLILRPQGIFGKARTV
jgi:branched-chain amino acid transport system permease protein